VEVIVLRIVSALVILAFAFTGSPAVAAGVTVAVNGQPLYLNPGPIEQAGRVFVPLRGIFERLGASVVYQSGQINSTKGNTSVSLTIGSQQATVNGQPQTLDVAPFIVGATTYVPLRFVAQSLGAQVDYNGNTRLVAITAQGGGGYAPPPPRPNYPPPMPPPANLVQVGARQPSPGGRYGDRFVSIGAQFSHAVDPNSVRVLLDGNDITSRSNVTRNSFSYRPPAPYGFGTHEVRVSGVDRNGRRFATSWSFTTTQSAPPLPANRVIVSGRQPAPNATIDNRFAVIAADFAPQADAGSVRVRLDGNDISGRAGISGGGFSYKPPAPLDFGSHTVRVSGNARSGLPFDSSWSFTVRRSGPPQSSLTIRQPGANAVVGRTFTVAGSYAPNANIRVTAGASQTATGQFNGSTTAGPRGNFQITVNLTQLMGQQTVTVRIHATDPNSSQTAEQTLQLRFRPNASAANQ
jgi:hypothetical protein